MVHQLTLADFTSPDISFWVDKDERYLTEADNFYLELQARFGVLPEEVPATLPLPVRRVLMLQASLLVCRDRISISHRQAADGVFEDPWEKLYKIYSADLAAAMGTLSREVLLGGVVNLDGPAGRFYRGGAGF